MPSRLVLALFFVSCAHGSRSNGRTIETDFGPVTGGIETGVRVFKGIRYAAKPERWKPPTAPARWTELDATTPGAACIQPGRTDTSEDCLFLNVWVPENARDLPVMVFIHGGGFFANAGSDFSWDGARLARTGNVIVVTMNYRLSTLGFFAHPKVGAVSMGLLDQQAALKWVQRNIGNFGGDAANVTLFGQSAGAWSTCAHLAMPSSRGLFHKAILESGSCSNPLWFTKEQAFSQGEQLASAVGCDSLECLQKVDALKLFEALPLKRSMIITPGVWWGPVIDGEVLPELPMKAIREGRSAPVPLLLGWAHDEGNMHTIGLDAATQDDVDGFLVDNFGAQAKAVKAQYADGTRLAALNEMVSEGVYVCGGRRVANAWRQPVFVYEIAHALDDPNPHRLGATHNVELFFVFGNEDLISLSAREQELVPKVMTLWSTFARTGAPSMSWPRWSRESEKYLELDFELVTKDHPRRDRCVQWDSVER